MSPAVKQEFQRELEPYLQTIESGLQNLNFNSQIPLFYDPIRYFLDIPGKRIRPLLTLLAAEAVGQKAADALPVALAVELLHNFTLVHDDIMDQDETRRGHATIHKKWDVSTAILAGDGLMGLAFQSLLETRAGDAAAMTRRFTESMLIVCEGQGLDKMFETEPLVDSAVYLDMIARKTAVLLQLSCELGAMTATQDPEIIELFRGFGYALGMAFQIQDDLLDVTGNSKALGKSVGSDLQRHKQTILTIKMQKRYPDRDLFNLPVEDFVGLLHSSGILEEVESIYLAHFNTAYQKLAALPESRARNYLEILTQFIQQRNW